jgi:transcription elongation GreA/GreB family factor
MKRRLDKRALLERLRALLAERLEGLSAAQKATQAGAVHAETKQEHPKDTRAIEASYLARGLADRVETLRDGVAALARLELRELSAEDDVRLGALVGLRDEDGTETVCFLVPAGGGERLEADGVSVLVVTPRAPLGASLLGCGVGEQIEVELPGGRRWATVDWVS